MIHFLQFSISLTISFAFKRSETIRAKNRGKVQSIKMRERFCWNWMKTRNVMSSKITRNERTNAIQFCFQFEWEFACRNPIIQKSLITCVFDRHYRHKHWASRKRKIHQKIRKPLHTDSYAHTHTHSQLIWEDKEETKPFYI